MMGSLNLGCVFHAQSCKIYIETIDRPCMNVLNELSCYVWMFYPDIHEKQKKMIDYVIRKGTRKPYHKKFPLN